MQYTQGQIDAAIHDVRDGKSISKAAKDHGVPFTSLYRKIKSKGSVSSPSSAQPPSPSVGPPLSPSSPHPFLQSASPQFEESSQEPHLSHQSHDPDNLPITFESEYPPVHSEDSNPDLVDYQSHSGHLKHEADEDEQQNENFDEDGNQQRRSLLSSQSSAEESRSSQHGGDVKRKEEFSSHSALETVERQESTDMPAEEEYFPEVIDPGSLQP